MILDLIKVFLPAAISFIVGIMITPLWTSYLFKNEMWKKKAGKVSLEGGETPIFNELHKTKEVGTPRMGGVIIWASTFITITLLWLASHLLPFEIFDKLEFLSRSQTWIPFFALLLGAFVGFIDDMYEIKGNGSHKAGGLSLKKRLLVVSLIGLFCALWFYFKLEVSSVGMLFSNPINLGVLFIPFFVAVMLFIYSGGIIDGIDGLAGGVFAIMFTGYGMIAFFQNQIDIAALCATIVGGLLAFLWFNIPPARFYMSETGSMALTVVLSIVAFMTDTLGGGHGVSALLIIGAPLVITSLSVIIQQISKRFRGGKKVFLVAPLHHHFEALGWPSYKVTMRYWVMSIVLCIIGVIFALIK
jgi:phospho-N-acetylmuramoyl-pentapeptide-transferase